MKVGLIGWLSATGNGAMTSDIARLAPWVTKVLAPSHPRLGYHGPYVMPVKDKLETCSVGDLDAVRAFVRDLDALLFIEQPYLRPYEKVVDIAHKRGIPVIAIPMWEWWPVTTWSKNVDMVWCVTKFTGSHMSGLASKHADNNWEDWVVQGRWGVDLEHFRFQQRETCSLFLFANGNGGYNGRKGADVLSEAAKLTDAPIAMLTQTKRFPAMPASVSVHQGTFPERSEVYGTGDVFLAPTHWEGLGHQLYEAQACGMPVITTDAPPMNESGAEFLVPAAFDRHRMCGKMIDRANPNPEKLAELMDSLHGADISELSSCARERMERNHNLLDCLEELRHAIQLRLEHPA